MPRYRMLLILAAAAYLGSAAIAHEQVGASGHTRPHRAARAVSSYHPMATVQDLMRGMIDPASKVVFNAVSSEVTPNGTVETAPKTDTEWAEVRQHALMMVEGANLLLMPGRHMASPENAQKHNEGELSPAEIEVRVARDRASWTRLAVAFQNAAAAALKAAEGRRTQDFNTVNEAIDNACENCHLKYWYPDQEQLLRNAPRPDQPLKP